MYHWHINLLCFCEQRGGHLWPTTPLNQRPWHMIDMNDMIQQMTVDGLVSDLCVMQ